MMVTNNTGLIPGKMYKPRGYGTICFFSTPYGGNEEWSVTYEVQGYEAFIFLGVEKEGTMHFEEECKVLLPNGLVAYGFISKNNCEEL